MQAAHARGPDDFYQYILIARNVFLAKFFSKSKVKECQVIMIEFLSLDRLSRSRQEVVRGWREIACAKYCKWDTSPGINDVDSYNWEIPPQTMARRLSVLLSVYLSVLLSLCPSVLLACNCMLSPDKE